MNSTQYSTLLGTTKSMYESRPLRSLNIDNLLCLVYCVLVFFFAARLNSLNSSLAISALNFFLLRIWVHVSTFHIILALAVSCSYTRSHTIRVLVHYYGYTSMFEVCVFLTLHVHNMSIIYFTCTLEYSVQLLVSFSYSILIWSNNFVFSFAHRYLIPSYFY